MSTQQRSRGKLRIIAAALAVAASGLAFADDSSMSRWTGDSYAFFNGLDYRPGGFNTARVVPPTPDKAIARDGAIPHHHAMAMRESMPAVDGSQQTITR